MSSFLLEAEGLEETAAADRVGYYGAILGRGRVRSLLDVGCGNGYAVRDWRAKGLAAFGVDLAFYRLRRWTEEHPHERPFVVADAAALPFRPGTFDAVVSSGMIEHVGVDESPNPYTVRRQPDCADQRQAVTAELLRVADADGMVFVDCPNGTFPIDFWHGDRIGAFRFHRIPDVLLPTFGDFRRWGSREGFRPVPRPIAGRLRFRQISRRWWGRLSKPLMAVFLGALDRLARFGWGTLAAPFYPYLVVELERHRTRS